MSDNTSQDGNVAPKPLELTMITAVERSNGIGRAGDLPWTLKQELKYFTRITKRVPFKATNGMNAVIMGRKSWDALPVIVRPLPGRINVIVSRSSQAVWSQIQEEGCNAERIHVVASVGEGVKLLQRLYTFPMYRDVGHTMDELNTVKLGRVFVIGGAEIYTAALEMRQTVRLLLTRIYADFECDTFFPAFLDKTRYGEWHRQNKDKMDRWVGEDVPQGLVTENGLNYEFIMYERNNQSY
ncbi:hypothetical protein K469DRAFT_740282 [Zopfia rhizophila CBS 207.26]|uniref:Dihydrofolate reductase n=1 Tax=Zopfia rhizophila CBS 207.26 TaxID=1314779 RepID=A0A6A6DRY2_9PEZI|nr:hypothetical protein K469DRAFT_740282 [Zopfia rhizophila CBS 207.26]